MSRVEHDRVNGYHCLPRMYVLLKVFYPDDYMMDAGEIVHSRIAAEQDSVFHRAGGCPNRVQGAHQVQDFTEAVSRSGVILIWVFSV